MDASDPYASTELEQNGDEADASYPEGGRQYGSLSPNEDDEDTGDAEPSLGSSGHGKAGSISYTCKPISDGFQMVYDCEQDDCDDEPSLGSKNTAEWGNQTIWGAGDNTDLEDEHDGTEPDHGDDEPSAGFDIGEPSLGWTVDGCVTGGTGQGRWDVQDDLEISVY